VIWDSTGTVIDGCEIYGRPVDYVDNHNGIRLEHARSATVRNCRIQGIVGQTPGTPGYLHHNNAGFMLYFSSNVVIEHNEISNSGVGVFPKGGDNSNITIRLNRIRDNSKGIRVSHTLSGTMYQNVITSSAAGTIGIEIAENSSNMRVANNTIVASDSGIYLHPEPNGTNISIANNIIANAGTGLNGWESPAAVPGPGRNAYIGVGQWATNGRTYSSLVSWVLAAPAEALSLVIPSAFVNAAAGNYRLTPSSQALTLGIDILDLDRDGSTNDTVAAGAYVRGDETIGPTTTGLPPGPVPNAPGAMTVQ
jgi:hypothetical protein